MSRGVLYPARPLTPAGPEGRREEYRWRLQCDQPGCTTNRVVRGAVLAARVQRALAAGRYVDDPGGKLRGRARRYAQEAIRDGLLRSWEEVRREEGPRRLVSLVLGEDL